MRIAAPVPTLIPQCPPSSSATHVHIDALAAPVGTDGWHTALAWAVEHLDLPALLAAPVYTTDHIPWCVETNYVNCVNAVLQAQNQFAADSAPHHTLLPLFLLLPKLLLRCSAKDTMSVVAGKVQSTTQHFMRGHWAFLVERIVRPPAVLPSLSSRPADAPLSEGSMAQAVRLGQYGNLRKCMQMLGPKE